MLLQGPSEVLFHVSSLAKIQNKWKTTYFYKVMNGL